MEKDHCMICNVETPYDKDTHIDVRLGYIEGVGQLCSKCYSEGTNHINVLIPEFIITKTPNNHELGAKVREIYWNGKNL
jgi:hypothetical protein